MLQELLGVDEVAAYLDVHPMTIYRWCRPWAREPVTRGKVAARFVNGESTLGVNP